MNEHDPAPTADPIPASPAWSVVRGGRSSVGCGATFGALDDLISRLAETAVTVLIRGERGTGKEIAARAIHARSWRSGRAFVKVNCRGPATLLETELFGCERGAIPGATQDRPGRLEFANHGTLYLDDIGELPLSVQAKLLDVLRNGGTPRLGGRVPIQVDVRLIAATDQYLEQAVLEGRFEHELLVRLNAVSLTLPPLRQRRSEIAAIVRHFAGVYAERFNRPPLELSEETLRVLASDDWPGNIAELDAHVRRMVIEETPDLAIARSVQHAPPAGRVAAEPAAPTTASEAAPAPGPGASLKTIARQAADAAERALIFRALRLTRWNRRAAAEMLGVSYKALLLKIKRAELSGAS